MAAFKGNLNETGMCGLEIRHHRKWIVQLIVRNWVSCLEIHLTWHLCKHHTPAPEACQILNTSKTKPFLLHCAKFFKKKCLKPITQLLGPSPHSTLTALMEGLVGMENEFGTKAILDSTLKLPSFLSQS
jgi:hypothetical protein